MYDNQVNSERAHRHHIINEKKKKTKSTEFMILVIRTVVAT